MFRHIRLAKTNFQQIQKLKTYTINPPKPKIKGVPSELMLKTKKCSDTLDKQICFSLKNQKCSSELLLKTKNIQTH